MGFKIIIFLTTWFVSIFVMAQDQLRVEYELIQPEENFRFEGMPQGIELIIPKQYYELILNQEEAIWRSIERISNEQHEDKGMVGLITFAPEGELYKNIQSKKYIKEEESYSKKYLVKDDLVKRDWKITRESKNVIGIKTRKATFEDKGMKLIAWYAPELKFKNGPDKYWGLPGLILELEITYSEDNGGREIYTYVAKELKTLKSNKKIVPPVKGIVVTQEELNQINMENFGKMMEMREQGVDKD